MLLVWVLSLCQMLNCLWVIYFSEQKRLAAKQREDAWEGKWMDITFFLKTTWFSRDSRIFCFFTSFIFLSQSLLPSTEDESPWLSFFFTRYQASHTHCPVACSVIWDEYWSLTFTQCVNIWIYFHKCNFIVMVCTKVYIFHIALYFLKSLCPVLIQSRIIGSIWINF